MYPACKIYYGECDHCRDNYLRETVRNTVTRWSEYNNPDGKSELAEQIKGILIVYSIRRFYAQLLHRNISGRN